MWFNIGSYTVVLKTPDMPPLFSERNSYQKPVLSMAGYRLFIIKGKNH